MAHWLALRKEKRVRPRFFLSRAVVAVRVVWRLSAGFGVRGFSARFWLRKGLGLSRSLTKAMNAPPSMSVFKNGSSEFESLAFVFATCALPKEGMQLDGYTGICSFTALVPLPIEQFNGSGTCRTEFRNLLWSEIQSAQRSTQRKLQDMCRSPLSGSVRLLAMDHEVQQWP